MFFRASSLDSFWSWDTFVNPFRINMWIVSVTNILLSAIVLYTTNYVRNFRDKRNGNSTENQNTKEEHEFNLANCLFIAFSAHVQQGNFFTTL